MEDSLWLENILCSKANTTIYFKLLPFRFLSDFSGQPWLGVPQAVASSSLLAQERSELWTGLQL